MNSKDENKTNEIEIIKSINNSLELLKFGQFEDALSSFSLILKKHYSNSIAESGIKCCKYWIPRIVKINKLNENYDKGKILYEEWKKFEKFLTSLKNIQSKVVNNVMFYIFNSALNSFKKEIRDKRILDSQTTYIIAVSYKKIGDFNNAIKYFEESLNIEHDNSNFIAQLADCYALIDEEKKAKLLFREAFFSDPSSIDTEQIDSNIVTYIITKLIEFNISRNEFNYWIPVYGRILNIFNIYREMLPQELSKLKSEIFFLEKNYLKEINKDNIFKTKLINSYLWLYDYYKTKENKEELDNIENKIKNIDEVIFKIFKDENKTLRSKNECNANK